MQTPTVTFKVTPHELEVIVTALRMLGHAAIRLEEANPLEGFKRKSVGTLRHEGRSANELLNKIGMVG